MGLLQPHARHSGGDGESVVTDHKGINPERLGLVRDSFPEIACLRCKGHDFDVFPNVTDLSGLGVVTLACSRCGFIEQHLIGTLRTASKPIVELTDES